MSDVEDIEHMELVHARIRMRYLHLSYEIKKIKQTWNFRYIILYFTEKNGDYK